MFSLGLALEGYIKTHPVRELWPDWVRELVEQLEDE